jgi:hypothetical protein
VAVFLALQAVVFTIDGWDGVIYFGEEVRERAVTCLGPFSAERSP